MRRYEYDTIKIIGDLQAKRIFIKYIHKNYIILKLILPNKFYTKLSYFKNKREKSHFICDSVREIVVYFHKLLQVQKTKL